MAYRGTLDSPAPTAARQREALLDAEALANLMRNVITALERMEGAS